jgi:hypothetical protein
MNLSRLRNAGLSALDDTKKVQLSLMVLDASLVRDPSAARIAQQLVGSDLAGSVRQLLAIETASERTVNDQRQKAEMVRGQADAFQTSLQTTVVRLRQALPARIDNTPAVENTLAIANEVSTAVNDFVRFGKPIEGAIVKAANLSQDLAASLTDLKNKGAAMGRSVGSFVEAGSAVVALSKQLGVDPGVVRTAQQVVSTAQTANRLVSAIASGNPLNAIASIGGMLFGGPDIAEIRHQELLRRFDEVMESQRQIQSTLRDIQFQIAGLSDQMKQQHAEVMQQLKEIREALSVQTSILVSGLDTQLASCRSLADSLEVASTYDDKSAVLRGNAALLANCKVSLTAILQPTGALDSSGVSASLRLATVLSGSHDDVLSAITRSLAKFEGLTEASQRARALELFECCGRTFAAVLAKQAMLEDPPENPLPLELVKLPLNDAFLVEVANLVLRLAPYLNLLDSASGGLLNPAIALSPDKARDLAVNADGTRQFLRRLALLTRVARVQRTMLSGDVQLSRFVANRDATDVAAILKDSAALRTNMVLYEVTRRLRANGITDTAYAIAIRLNDPDYFDLMVASSDRSAISLKFERTDKGIRVTMGGHSAFLPGPSLFRSEQQLPVSLDRIADVQDRIGTALTGMEILRQLPEQRRVAAFSTLTRSRTF